MYHTTGLSRDEVVELCTLIHSAETGPEDKQWPPSLGLFDSVVVTLTYLRRNRVQEELAETYGTSQPTISRAISLITSLIKKVLAPYVPTAEELDERCQYLVDGALLPCWSWAAHPELYSGKHKTTGMNVQVACTLAEKLAWISDPIEGSRHDNYCLNESGVLVTFDPADWIADKGYVGNGMITPIKKPQGGDLLDWEKEFNKSASSAAPGPTTAASNGTHTANTTPGAAPWTTPSSSSSKPGPTPGPATSIPPAPNWPSPPLPALALMVRPPSPTATTPTHERE